MSVRASTIGKISKIECWGIHEHAREAKVSKFVSLQWYYISCDHLFMLLTPHNGPNITGWAKCQWTYYVGLYYSSAVFYIWKLLLCKWHTVFTGSKIPSSKFKNSNVLDHAHSILKLLYCILWTCWMPNFSRDGRLFNVASDLKNCWQLDNILLEETRTNETGS